MENKSVYIRIRRTRGENEVKSRLSKMYSGNDLVAGLAPVLCVFLNMTKGKGRTCISFNRFKFCTFQS